MVRVGISRLTAKPYSTINLGATHPGSDPAPPENRSVLLVSLRTALTKTNNLKVTQVIVKVVDPEQYANNKRVKVLGRGIAGVY